MDQTTIYRRTVKAAVAETRSRFALAEALALDIPPRDRGRGGHEEFTVPQHLAWAAKEIEAAGGEPRSVATLIEYRETAVWVSGNQGKSLEFSWVEGASFSAHIEAHRGGMTYSQFAAMSSHTVNAVRAALDRTGTRGRPEVIIGNMDSEQRESAARELLADEQTLNAVADQITDIVSDDADLRHQVQHKWLIKHPVIVDPPLEPAREEQITDEQVVYHGKYLLRAIMAMEDGRYTPGSAAALILASVRPSVDWDQELAALGSEDR